MSTSDHDSPWRRPPGASSADPHAGGVPGGGASPGPGPSGGVAPGPGGAPDAGFVRSYSGPPPSNPPPPHWRPNLVTEPLPPGDLPAQDHDRLDVEEQAAQTLTKGIGLVAGAIMLVLLLVLCARAVF